MVSIDCKQRRIQNFFAKKTHLNPLNISTKSFILDFWAGSEYDLINIVAKYSQKLDVKSVYVIDKTS